MKARALIEAASKRELLSMIRPTTVHIGIVGSTTKDDMDVYAARSQWHLNALIAAYCRGNWSNEFDGAAPPEDEDLIERYFELNDSQEWYRSAEVPLNGPRGDTVWVWIMDHYHGTDMVAGTSLENANANMAQWVRDNWEGVQVDDQDLPPEDPEERIQTYLSRLKDATCNLEQAQLHD